MCFFEAAQVCSPPHPKEPSKILPAHLMLCFLVQMLHAYTSAHSPLSSQEEKARVQQRAQAYILRARQECMALISNSPNMVPLENCPTGPGCPIFFLSVFVVASGRPSQTAAEGGLDEMSPGSWNLSSALTSGGVEQTQRDRESHGSGVGRDLCEPDHKRKQRHSASVNDGHVCLLPLSHFSSCLVDYKDGRDRAPSEAKRGHVRRSENLFKGQDGQESELELEL